MPICVASNDGVDAISESILWVKKIESSVDEYYKEIDALIKLQNQVLTGKMSDIVAFEYIKTDDN